MSQDEDWDVDKYRDEYESDEQWELRRTFLERWKDNYPEERLVCLARVFINIEFMGCRYPLDVMKEVARLSDEIAKSYRQKRKTKLQRTFVSASDAAEDRARGVKRQGGIVTDSPLDKKSRFPTFVPQGHSVEDSSTERNSDLIVVIGSDVEDKSDTESAAPSTKTNALSIENNDYLKELETLKCVDVNEFSDSMLSTPFGKCVIILRPWSSKFENIYASCRTCDIQMKSIYEDQCFTFYMNDKLVARATGCTKAEARSVVESMAWNRLREECVTLLVKEQFIAQGSHITSNDVSGKSKSQSDEFGAPIENSVAMKMMKLMGWAGGGLGADSQGIAEPIKPNLQMIRRAGLGSEASDLVQFRRASAALMQRYRSSYTLDLDLVFASDFSKEERAELHQIARRCGLQSKSYGKDQDRFLVVKKKLDPFFLVKAIVDNGGSTPKYQVYIPATLRRKH